MDSLNRIPLFKDMEPALASRHAKSCIWKEYGEHELVIDVDDESNDVRFVMSGKVRIIHRIAIGKEVILGEMGEGDFFGEIAAIDDESRSANVTTLTRSRICIMPQALFLNILCQSREANLAVLRVLAQRVRQLNLRIAEHSFLQAKHRLYAELIRLSKPRAANPAHRTVSPPPIQRELAERIGTRREVVSRELAALEKQGVVEKTRGAIILTDVQELQRRISKALED